MISVEYENNSKTGRSAHVSGTQSYGLRVSKPDVPDTKALTYYDFAAGKTYYIDAPLTSLETTQSQWQDYTYIDIVVSNYTDTQFMFQNKIIKHNGDTVIGSEYYSELLSMAGLSGSDYKVTLILWLMAQ